MDTPTVLSLYSGGGGLDLGFRLALPGARCVCYVERDAAAIALLVDHMQTGQLDDAPLWSDSGTFDGKPWRGKVDWIIGGFPCQPWSVAGARAGTDDERWLWPHIERLVREIRPGGLFLENVPGLFHGGIEHVLGGLAALGYDAEWTTVRASDVGAPHRRARVFILAYAHGGQGILRQREQQELDRDSSGLDDTESQRTRSDSDHSRAPNRDGDTFEYPGEQLAHRDSGLGDISIETLRTGRAPTVDGDGDVGHAGHGAGSPEHGQQSRQGQETSRTRESSAVGDTPIDGLQEGERRINGLRTGSDEGSVELGDSQSIKPGNRERGSGETKTFTRSSRDMGFPPGPSDTDAWAKILRERPNLAPAVESEVRDLADGLAGGLVRTDRLRILGNGVVPQQASLAFRILADRIIK